MSLIFLSHSSRNDAAAGELRHWLASEGHTAVFLDHHDRDGIVGGEAWEERLYTELRRCRVLVALVSAEWLVSPWCVAEVNHAQALRKTVIPVRIADISWENFSQVAPPVLRRVQAIDWRSGEEARGRLREALLRAGLDPKKVFAWSGDRDPFPGLAAFERADAPIYFGREQEVTDLLATLDACRAPDRPRLVVVQGTSGTGKSSLVRAGVLPMLERDPHRWIVLPPFRPLRAPLRELTDVLTIAAGGSLPESPPNSAAAGMNDRGSWPPWIVKMASEIRRRAGQLEATVLVTVDQLEEAVGGADEAGSTFLLVLRDALAVADHRLLVLATLRADFVSALTRHAALREPSSNGEILPVRTYQLGPLPRSAFHAVIEGPAELAGLELEPGLVSRLVHDAQTDDALPLLAFVLRELWMSQGRAELKLTKAMYDHFGGLENAVGDRAARIFADLHPTEEEIDAFRTTLLFGMAEMSSDGRILRRRLPLTAVPQGARRLVDAYADREARLLGKGGDFVEVVHDALFRRWRLLASWVEAAKDDLRARRRVEEAFHAWCDEKVDKRSRLLPAGRPLEEARDLLARPRILTDQALRHFVEESIDTEDQRQERLKKRRKRQLRLATGTACLFLILASLAGLLALRARSMARRAEMERRVASAQALAARAQTWAESRPDVAIGLAIRSIRQLNFAGASSTNGETALRAILASTRGQRVFCTPKATGDFSATATALDFTADGSLLAVGTTGALCIYRRDTNQTNLRLIEALQSFGREVEVVRFAKSGRWLVTQTSDGYLRALNLDEIELGKTTEPFTVNNYKFDTFGDRDRVGPASFDKANSRVAFHNPARNAVEVWSLDPLDPEGAPLFSFEASDRTLAVGLSDGGDRLITLTDGANGNVAGTLAEIRASFEMDMSHLDKHARFTVMIRNLSSGAVLEVTPVLDHIEELWLTRDRLVGHVSLSADSKWLVCALELEDPHRIETQLAADVWQISQQRPIRVQEYVGDYDGEHDGRWTRISNIGFSKDGEWLFAVRESSVRLWRTRDIATRPIAPVTLTVPYGNAGRNKALGVIYKTESSPDGRFLAVADSNRSLTVWDLRREISTEQAPWLFVEPRDPLFAEGSGQTVGFSRDSSLVGNGAGRGGLQLCRLADRCGPVQPRRRIAEEGEGQWVAWATAPDQRWVAAVSERRRIYFHHAKFQEQPFFVGSVVEGGERVPVTTREYAIVSGTPGRPIALVPSGDGAWAAAFERDQYGFNKGAALFKLDGAPALTRLDPDSLGCEYFEAAMFDPASRFFLTWYGGPASGRCATVIPLDIKNTAGAVGKTSRLPGYEGGWLRFSARGGFITSEKQWSTDHGKVWRCSGRSCVEVALASAKTIELATIDPNESWLSTVRKGKDGYWVEVSRITKNGMIDGSRKLGLYQVRPRVSFSPRSGWLMVLAREEKKQRLLVELWRTSGFDGPSERLYLPMEPVEATVEFDESETRFVIGPTTFLLPDAGPAPRAFKGLIGDLRNLKPIAQVFDVPIGDYVGGYSIGGGIEHRHNSEETSYTLSANGKWLATADPGNLWFIGNGKAEHIVSLGQVFALFSPSSQWMIGLSSEGTRLWSLRGERVYDHGLLGPPGSVKFSKGGTDLMLFANGEIATFPLAIDEVVHSAAVYMGRNMLAEDWEREFPGEVYEKIFEAYPRHITRLEHLVRRGEIAARDGDSPGASGMFREAGEIAIENKSVIGCIAVIEAGMRAGVPDSVLASAEFAVRVLGRDAWVRDVRGKVRAAAGDFEGAKRDFGFVMRESPDRALTARRRGWVQRLGRGEQISMSELLSED